MPLAMRPLMEFELEWLDPSLLICRVSGVSTVEGCEALMQAVTTERHYRSGIAVITDQTGVDTSALTASDVEQIADLTVQFANVAAVRSAVVTGPDSPAAYGLARMLEAYVDSWGNTEIGVFETFDEAMVWLTEEDAQIPSEPPTVG